MAKKEKQTAYPKEFLEHLQSITATRARVVIDHILKYGFITTDDLQDKEKFGHSYTQGPRAARDVREAGIPLETYRVKSERTGRWIAAYKFGDLTQIQTGRIAGRIQFSKHFKHQLYEACSGRCKICNGQFEERYLQVDHRVPYEVAGDTLDRSPEHFMLLCGSCNRAKSWSCEHCENWQRLKQPKDCLQCYWGTPDNYNHIAMEQVRRLDLQWSGDEIKYYDAIKLIAQQQNIELPKFIKQVLAKRANRK
ncbi:HNH endonuclease signature motif containing protein [Flavisolibacter ginsenosidimutans]|uniref:HNH endonuclease n=1 Tax=Flavisolibacter ginsenosidimutans TaxID=661481 RepID=A0A5B8ULT0_9BACT|nr:HNH endonuclease signature motif containing protein [Flavisolibacter ginsenosidimutans]QEC57010.1 HNH endonuclease [Flavisolibacter ginsenosidimutans]